jgi:hypothetical protein
VRAHGSSGSHAPRVSQMAKELDSAGEAFRVSTTVLLLPEFLPDLVEDDAVVLIAVQRPPFQQAEPSADSRDPIASPGSSPRSARAGSAPSPGTGNAHVCRALVEAVWSYRHRPAIGYQPAPRSEGQPVEVLAHARSARRLT